MRSLCLWLNPPKDSDDMVSKTHHWVIVSEWTHYCPPSVRLLSGDESFLHCKWPDATMDWNQWLSWYDCRWGKYTMFNLQWRSACSGCEREASVKDEAGKNKAIVYIPVSECQSIMSSPPLSSLAIHRSLLRGFPTSFPARQWRYGDIVTMLEVESEVKAINVIVVTLVRAYCMKQKRD